jgi:hypothetical protein
MRTAVVVLLLILGGMPVVRAEMPEIEIAMFPYDHDPAPAWRVVIVPNGSVLYEETAEPVKLVNPPADSDLLWVERPHVIRRTLSLEKQDAMVAELRALGLNTLKPSYSAEFAYLHPTDKTTVIEEDGRVHFVPAEVQQLVTHGRTLRLRVTSSRDHTETTVYCPLTALEFTNPKHPDRDAIVTFVAGWRAVLRAVGDVNGLKAAMFQDVPP